LHENEAHHGSWMACRQFRDLLFDLQKVPMACFLVSKNQIPDAMWFAINFIGMQRNCCFNGLFNPQLTSMQGFKQQVIMFYVLKIMMFTVQIPSRVESRGLAFCI
jgi:hypothetical protein